MTIDRVKADHCGREGNSVRSRLGTAALYMMLGVGMTSLSGCTAMTGLNNAWTYNSYWNGSMMGFRNSSYAHKAWHSRKHSFANEQYLKDFQRGFKAGYNDVAGGGKGCTPTFPPREYWGWRYQSCEGQARVAAWFSGFPHGARAAEEDGIGQWHQIQSSSRVQQEYVDYGLMPSEHNGMYPVPETKNPAGVPNRTLMSREYDPMVSEAEVIETGVIPIPQSQIPAPIPNFPVK
jgi:hypothetical protein